MPIRHLLVTCAAACLLLQNVGAVTLSADGQWNAFDVDSLSAGSGGTEWIDIGNGQALHFTFDIGAGLLGDLTVVDGGYAGDSFKVYNGAKLLGGTSAPTDSDPFNVYSDFDAALANADYSRRSFQLAAGHYDITGLLDRSALIGGVAYDATVGAIRLSVSAVPEPANAALLLVGLALVGMKLNRRRI
jgi:hypothetical protein